MTLVECAGKEGRCLSETTGGSRMNSDRAIGVEGCGDVASYTGDCLFPLAFAHVLPVDQSVGRLVELTNLKSGNGGENRERQVQRPR
jgi:hypothetical protein